MLQVKSFLVVVVNPVVLTAFAEAAEAADDADDVDLVGLRNR